MIAFPNCKINLGLHILSKRPDGFHNLQTIFYPFPLTDALEVIRSTGTTTLTLSGLPLDTNMEANICYKACQLLSKDFPSLPSVSMHLHKTIPSGAGLGGGSADGAFTLLLLNKKFGLGLTEQQLYDYALQLGSDCPFFIWNKPGLATGRGEKLEPIELDLSPYNMVLIYPGIPISTAWAFSQISPSPDKPSLKTIITQNVETWKEQLTNDFEGPVFTAYPEIAQIRQQLYEAGATYAALSGTGSTVYGLFKKEMQVELLWPKGYVVKWSGKREL